MYASCDLYIIQGKILKRISCEASWINLNCINDFESEFTENNWQNLIAFEVCVSLRNV